MPQKGKFHPRNPDKYIGKVDNIIYRSRLELRVMSEFDSNENVIKWSSEELIVPYISPIDKRMHRYFPDFVIQAKTSKNIIETIMIEVKPDQQTRPPNKPKTNKHKRRFIAESITYGINQAKWAAATAYCKDKNWTFKIMTEKEIFGK